MLSYLLLALCFALVAVTWAVVLVDTDMLLQPVQRWVREKYVRYRINGLLRYVFKDEPHPDTAEFADTRKGIEAYPQSYRLDLDSQWWWNPLWGCARCVAGQLSLWAYPLLCWRGYYPYQPLAHVLLVCASIFLAAVLQRVYQWSQQ